MVLETHPAIRPCVSPSEQPLRKCQVNPLPASPALSTWVCGPAIFTRYREICWNTDEKWGSGGRWGNVLLFGREDFEKAVLLLGVCVWSCIKILCWVHTFPFLISWVKFHCVYMPHARKWMGKCEEQKEAGEVVGKEKTKIIFVWKMSWWVLILCKLITNNYKKAIPRDLAVIFQSKRKRLQKKSQQKGVRKNLMVSQWYFEPWESRLSVELFFASVEI